MSRYDDIVMVSVEFILQVVQASCDFGSIDEFMDEGMDIDDARTAFWQHIIDYKSSDSGFVDLVNSYLEHGWAEGSAIGWDDSDFEITEGHHRLTLAILMGLDEVPTFKWGINAPNAAGEHVAAHHGWGDKTPFLV